MQKETTNGHKYTRIGSADAHIREFVAQFRRADVGIRAPVQRSFIDSTRARKSLDALYEHGRANLQVCPTMFMVSMRAKIGLETLHERPGMPPGFGLRRRSEAQSPLWIRPGLCWSATPVEIGRSEGGESLRSSPHSKALACATIGRAIVALCLTLLMTERVRAVIMTPLSLQELATQAQLVVHGTVVNKSCQRDPEGRIYTKVELHLIDVWKGTPANNPLTIVHGGGTLGGERVVVTGQVEYNLREEVVAFLVLNQRGEAVTVGMAQGKFHVSKDQATGNLLVRNPFHGSDSTPTARSQSAGSQSPAPLTLAAFKARVKKEEK